MPDIRSSFSLNRGIVGVFDSVSEIARRNLPDSTQLVPGGEVATAQVYGKLAPSGFHQDFKHSLCPEIVNRQLQIPGMVATVLDGLAARMDGAENPSEKQAALRQCLEEIRHDKKLCDMYRSLLVAG